MAGHDQVRMEKEPNWEEKTNQITDPQPTEKKSKRERKMREVMISWLNQKLPRLLKKL